MAKLKTDPISQTDLIEFLNSSSGFAFEIQVLNTLDSLGFKCDHGGTYDDPATRKSRQFDIRAFKRFENWRQEPDHLPIPVCFIRLAVECKNLRPHSPLLISCMPRRSDEAFHQIVYSVNPEIHPLDTLHTMESYSAMGSSSCINVPLVSGQTIYRFGSPVGKSCDQVARTLGGDITGGDAGIYDKWAQALSSADDLTYLACTDGRDRTTHDAFTVVFALLVVPNGQLWTCQFSEHGSRLDKPKTVDHCSLFVGRAYFHQIVGEFTMSHLDIVTLDGLTKFVKNRCESQIELMETFPVEHVAECLRSIQ